MTTRTTDPATEGRRQARRDRQVESDSELAQEQVSDLMETLHRMRRLISFRTDTDARVASTDIGKALDALQKVQDDVDDIAHTLAPDAD